MLVDAGNFAGRQPATASARGLFLLEAAKSLGYDAITLGDGDAALGGDLLRSLAEDPSLPLVSANLRDERRGKLLLPATRVVEKGGVKVGITAVTAAATPEGGRLGDEGIEPLDPAEVLAEVLPALRRRSDFVVVLARMPLSKAKELGERFPDVVDAFVIGGLEPGRGLVGPENGGAVYVTAGDRGQSFGRVRAKLDAKRRPERIVADEILLVTTFPESPAVLDMVAEFQTNLNEILKVEAVRTAQGRASPDGSYYVGATACGTCHRREYEVWQESRHAHAFQTLVDAGVETMPECFRCHVTGADDPAGYAPGLPETHSLRNVQCEVCHDKGSHHARDGTWGASLLRNACARCHDAENSPDFDPEVYWSMIEH